MARKTSSGLPFLVRRKDGGKYVYWRILDAAIAPFVCGEIHRSWAVASHVLSGKPIVKLSLQTGDHATACDRWSEVHARVEALIRDATTLAKRDKETKQNLEKARTLTSEQIATIAGQARHDVLADHDAGWTDPDHLSPTARGLQRALQARREHKLRIPWMLEFLRSFPDDLSLDGVRAAAREMDARTNADMLETKSTLSLDRPTAVVEELIADPNGPPGAMMWKPFAERPGELTERLNENGVELPEDSDVRRALALAVLRAKMAGHRDVAAREAGQSIETQPRPAPINVADDDPVPTLRGLHKLWRDRNKPGRKAIDDNLLYVERFIAMHGDLPADKIKRKQVRAYRDLVAKFPRAQPHELDGKSPEEIAAWAEARPNLPKLTPMTVNHKGLGAISTLIDLAIKEYDLEGNPCTGLQLPVEPGDRTKRLPFSLADLKRLFLESPVYRNPPKVSAASCGAAGFWIPLIALFEGARLEEIGQLLIEDVKIEDGIPYFYITVINDDDEDGGPAGSRKRAKGGAVSAEKTLKTPASRRRLPVHRLLIEFGFLDYVERRRAAGDKRLFPELTSYRGRRTKNWSRWWGRYQDAHVSGAKEKCFHSFRHTFIDAMRLGGIRIEHQVALVGHAAIEGTDQSSKKKTIDGYGTGYPIAVLDPELQKVAYPGLDLSHLAAVAKFFD
jgi:integrase